MDGLKCRCATLRLQERIGICRGAPSMLWWVNRLATMLVLELVGVEKKANQVSNQVCTQARWLEQKEITQWKYRSQPQSMKIVRPLCRSATHFVHIERPGEVPRASVQARSDHQERCRGRPRGQRVEDSISTSFLFWGGPAGKAGEHVKGQKNQKMTNLTS